MLGAGGMLIGFWRVGEKYRSIRGIKVLPSKRKESKTKALVPLRMIWLTFFFWFVTGRFSLLCVYGFLFVMDAFLASRSLFVCMYKRPMIHPHPPLYPPR